MIHNNKRLQPAGTEATVYSWGKKTQVQKMTSRFLLNVYVGHQLKVAAAAHILPTGANDSEHHGQFLPC